MCNSKCRRIIVQATFVSICVSCLIIVYLILWINKVKTFIAEKMVIFEYLMSLLTFILSFFFLFLLICYEHYRIFHLFNQIFKLSYLCYWNVIIICLLTIFFCCIFILFWFYIFKSMQYLRINFDMFWFVNLWKLDFPNKERTFTISISSLVSVPI